MLSPLQGVTLLVLGGVLVAVVALVAGIGWSRQNARDGWLRRVARRAEGLERRLEDVEKAVSRIDRELCRREGTIGLPGGPRQTRPAGAWLDVSPVRSDGPEAPGPKLIAVPDLSKPDRASGSLSNAQAEAARRASALADQNRRFGAVWSMAASGASAGTIARATGQPVGQVELILNLRRRLAEGVSDHEPRR